MNKFVGFTLGAIMALGAFALPGEAHASSLDGAAQAALQKDAAAAVKVAAAFNKEVKSVKFDKAFAGMETLAIKVTPRPINLLPIVKPKTTPQPATGRTFAFWMDAGVAHFYDHQTKVHRCTVNAKSVPCPKAS